MIELVCVTGGHSGLGAVQRLERTNGNTEHVVTSSCDSGTQPVFEFLFRPFVLTIMANRGSQDCAMVVPYVIFLAPAPF